MLYNDMANAKAGSALERTLEQLERGDFRAADVRKMSGGTYYRAKLNESDRLLFRYGACHGETCLLVLEIIKGHAYDRSRFLNGAKVDEAKLVIWHRLNPETPEEMVHLPFIHPVHPQFHLLDKPLSFDDRQNSALQRKPPLILIGSAGSGKTALTVEKLKQLTGRVLYVTLSPYLVENARNLYAAHRYDNPQVEIDFFSFDELIQSIKIPEGQESTFRMFAGWYSRFRNASRSFDAHPLFEEFRGVLTGWQIHKPYLSRDDYLALGVKQSIFLGEERNHVYTLFDRYRGWLKEQGLRDANMTAHAWLDLVRPCYDFVVIDEVQDLTNIQIHLALSSLRIPSQFILCGDANQIVHPNFFSWSHVKSLFYERTADPGGGVNIAEVLVTNYRNTPEVTDLANRLLILKNARFGSIDRESNYLVSSVSPQRGTIELISHDPKVLRDLNEKTRRSTRFAVITLRDEEKAEARAYFQTPLVFSIQEAKGLEYDNIILYNVVSSHAAPFDNIIDGVEPDALNRAELTYARSRDKTDKSLDAYKFYINALYVAVTRSMKNLYLVECRTQHRLFELWGLRIADRPSKVAAEQSSEDEWAREARRLEQQGKREQADLIRSTLLGHQPVPWPVVTPETLESLKAEALNPDHFNKKAKQLLYEYAVMYSRNTLIRGLARLNFKRAQHLDRSNLEEILRKYHRDVIEKKWGTLRQHIARHGVDYPDSLNRTPLMNAIEAGKTDLVKDLLDVGANLDVTDAWGRTPFHLALWNAVVMPGYATSHLSELYELLAPSHLSLRIENHLVKLDARTPEYFILHYMIAVIQVVLCDEWKRCNGFETADFIHSLSVFPEAIIPAYRCKRAYISSVLARHEIHREGPANRKLFVRIRRGYYLPNPQIDIKQGEAWIPFYDLIHFPSLAEEENNSFFRRMQQWILDSRENNTAGRVTENPTLAVDPID